MPEIINLNGKEFGCLTVEETYMKVENSGRRQKYCLCNCHCGNQLEVRAGSLTSGNTTSCGCKQKEVARELGRKDSRRQKYCLCNCHCGNQLEVRAGSLTSGNTTSCGCKQKEVARELGRKDSNSKDLTNQVSGGIRFIERTGTQKT